MRDCVYVSCVCTVESSAICYRTILEWELHRTLNLVVFGWRWRKKNFEIFGVDQLFQIKENSSSSGYIKHNHTRFEIDKHVIHSSDVEWWMSTITVLSGCAHNMTNAHHLGWVWMCGLWNSTVNLHNQCHLDMFHSSACLLISSLSHRKPHHTPHTQPIYSTLKRRTSHDLTPPRDGKRMRSCSPSTDSTTTVRI
jgi:hypothetical protein